MIPTGSEATTTEAIISSAKMQLKIEVTDSDFYFEKLINEAVRHLDCLSIFKKQTKELTVTDHIAYLPKGFYQLLALRIGRADGCSDAVYVNLPFAGSCGCGNLDDAISYSNAFEIQGNKIVFHDRGESITECVIAFMGMNVDDEGMFKVYQDFERALTAYLCWKYCQQNPMEYDRGLRAEYKAEWIAQKKWIKSIEFYNNFINERLQVNEWASALIVDKSFN